MKGFREFIMRGNVIELATAVIIGTAFSKIVDALVAGIFNPLISAMFNADDLNGAVWDVAGIKFGVGAVLAAIINFLIIAAVIYFLIVLPFNKLNDQLYLRRHGHLPPAEEEAASETELLTEIRDLLQAQKQQ